ncbi:helix-turn-helix domain-containing protein [Lactobacillus acetotolerans]|jgi:hypothetical protein|uniref:HTH cro/C1-type domain-containing protein n=1 Tax=Lactobacillus acetotolerans TaxID=1600 RepID=A0A0D6A5C5_9LACO|nr:helix-turn-helix domain-containing protein [Lactobacillus acetotolerans]QGV03986.1 helix-turn-helix domain-containing protein [Lactobacillus acetotolerans]QJD72953.1 helix-turn-helix transcriptional regulator [Lactobacillus acetotolerans]BAQ57909.1 conserved hypothetical protein [Lactobacillus acetotolerans]HBG91477.1 XRE family transcriptional regulator [Lactobacillus acetotolerans]HBQ42722.1 XRE family transcriptional regulator [Lactobacillus acetotolerans]
MANPILGYLDNQRISINEVSKKSGVAVSTLDNAVKKSIESWSIRTLDAFALALNEKPGDLLNKLQPNPYTLNIKDGKQTIQGVYIPDKEMYQQIRSAVEDNHLEGWNPTSKDVKFLLKNALNPNPKDMERIDRIWNEGR